jgi:hypothetical protein
MIFLASDATMALLGDDEIAESEEPPGHLIFAIWVGNCGLHRSGAETEGKLVLASNRM